MLYNSHSQLRTNIFSSLSTMSSENTECFFEIDTSVGWEKSLTKVLSSFEDPVFDINPTLGYAYVKGKTDRRQILTKLKKGGKHSELKRITFQGDGNINNNNNNNYAPLAKMGPLYDPNYYHANDSYNYPSYASYNPWHNSSNHNHLLMNNAPNYHGANHNHLLMNNAPNYHGANHHYLRRPRLHAGPSSFHRHDSSSVPSSSTSSTTSRQVTEPEQPPRPPVREPLRFGPFRRLGFIKKVKLVFSMKKVTGKLRSCLRFCRKAE